MAVEQGLPPINEAVYDELPPLIDNNERNVGPSVNNVVGIEPPLLVGYILFSDSDVLVSSSGSRRRIQRKHKKGAR